MSVKKFITFSGKKTRKSKHILLLHLNILIFSFTGIFSKCAANSLNGQGKTSIMFFVFLLLMVINCGIYALFWQQTIKKFDINVAYAHKTVCNIWSLIWAVFIFSEKVTMGNIVGTMIIIFGLAVLQSE